MCLFTSSAPRPIQSISWNICLLSVPWDGTRNCVDWRLLVKESIAKIEILWNPFFKAVNYYWGHRPSKCHLHHLQRRCNIFKTGMQCFFWNYIFCPIFDFFLWKNSRKSRAKVLFKVLLVCLQCIFRVFHWNCVF